MPWNSRAQAVLTLTFIALLVTLEGSRIRILRGGEAPSHPAMPIILGKEGVPVLKSVHTDALIWSSFAEVKLTQEFANPLDVPLNSAEYVFILDNHAAVHHVKATFGSGHIIESHVALREEAHEKYHEAVSSGAQAVMVEKSLNTDLYELYLGNIGPSETVKVELSYSTEMSSRGSLKDRLFIPTRVKERYGDAPVSPSHILTADTKMSADVHLMVQPTPRVTSPTGRPLVYMSPQPWGEWTGAGHARVAMASVPQQEDVAFDFDYSEEVASQAPWLVQTAGHSEAEENLSLAVTFRYSDPVEEEEANEILEHILVLDRSGSMNPNIDDAIAAMNTFLRSLPPQSYFNIIAFGSSYRHFRPESVRYEDTSLRDAVDFVTQWHNMGGTEMAMPLKLALNSDLPGEAVGKRVYLVTDGAVWDVDEVIEIVTEGVEALPNTRVFSLGIGHGASHDLCDRIAAAGLGSAEYVLSTEDDLARTVVRQLSDAAMPSGIIHLKANVIGANGEHIPFDSELDMMAEVGSLPNHSRVTFYFFNYDDKATQAKEHLSVKLTGEYHGEPFEIVEPFIAQPPDESGTIARVGVNALLWENEDSFGVNRIESLGVRYGVVTTRTSLVGVAPKKHSVVDDDVVLLMAATSSFGAVGSAPAMRVASAVGEGRGSTVETTGLMDVQIDGAAIGEVIQNAAPDDDDEFGALDSGAYLKKVRSKERSGPTDEALKHLTRAVGGSLEHAASSSEPCFPLVGVDAELSHQVARKQHFDGGFDLSDFAEINVDIDMLAFFTNDDSYLSPPSEKCKATMLGNYILTLSGQSQLDLMVKKGWNTWKSLSCPWIASECSIFPAKD